MIAVRFRFAEWPMKPTESTLVTWSKFDPPLWGKRWDGLPVFTHTRNHSLTDKRCRQRELYCRAFGLLDPTALLFETTACAWLRISSFLKSFLLKWGKPDLESFFTAFLPKWEIHSQGNLRLKMDSSTDDAFQGKSHDTAFSHSLICLIDE